MVKGELRENGVIIAVSIHKRCLLSYTDAATSSQLRANKLIYFHIKLHNLVQPGRGLRSVSNADQNYLSIKPIYFTSFGKPLLQASAFSSPAPHHRRTIEEHGYAQP